MGSLLVGLLLYFFIRPPRGYSRRDSAHAKTSESSEGLRSGSTRYEKPELVGEDARKEMDAAERRKPELSGEDARKEMDGTERRKAELSGRDTRVEIDGTPAKQPT